jgi:tRNA(fMet)-specific endonuclease VapC
MRYLLDTNICIYVIKRRPPQVLARFQRCIVGDIGLSTVTLAELQYGVAKSAFPARNQEALDAFTLPLEGSPLTRRQLWRMALSGPLWSGRGGRLERWTC